MLRRFIAYQDDFTSLPSYATNENNETAEALPSFLLQAAAIIKETGWTQETVFALPLGQIIWLNSAFAYLSTGKTSVISDKETAARFALRQLTKGSGNMSDVNVTVGSNNSALNAGLASAKNAVHSFKEHTEESFSELGKELAGAFAVGQ